MKIKKNGDLYQTLLLIICCCMGTLQCMKRTNFLEKSHADNNKHKNIPQHNGNKIEIKHLEDTTKITNCLKDYRKTHQQDHVQEPYK